MVDQIPAPINRLPAGLLSLLDVKSMGRTPNELAGFVQPTLEMSEIFRTLAYVSLTMGITALPIATPVASFQPFNVLNPSLVPQGEIWYVDEYAVQVDMTAAVQSALATPAYLLGPVSAPTVPAFASAFINSTAANNRSPRFPLLKPFWAPPGTQFGAYLHLWEVAAASNVLGLIKFARFAV